MNTETRKTARLPHKHHLQLNNSAYWWIGRQVFDGQGEDTQLSF